MCNLSKPGLAGLIVVESVQSLQLVFNLGPDGTCQLLLLGQVLLGKVVFDHVCVELPQICQLLHPTFGLGNSAKNQDSRVADLGKREVHSCRWRTHLEELEPLEILKVEGIDHA